MKFAPECVPLQDEPEKGEEYGSCLCRANGFQFMLDKCVEAKCSPKERKEVWAALGVCLIYLGEGIECKELHSLRGQHDGVV
jgi:hypothetical protein